MAHTTARMGDALAGFHAAWESGSDSVVIRFERGIRTPKLFQALGERRIPTEEEFTSKKAELLAEL